VSKSGLPRRHFAGNQYLTGLVVDLLDFLSMLFLLFDGTFFVLIECHEDMTEWERHEKAAVCTLSRYPFLPGP
jgi:hypothetical protein